MGEEAMLTALHIRAGRLEGSHNHFFTGFTGTDENLLSGFLNQLYLDDAYLPDEIVSPLALEDGGLLAEVLGERKGRRVQFLRPRRGERLKLLEMARRNAEVALEDRRRVRGSDQRIMEELQRRLKLRRLPERIACFDISSIQGALAVGSMVSFWRCRPEKGKYRKFRLKTVDKPDDYAAMYEVLERYLKRARQEGELPDLVLVDGGKGQLNVAREAARTLGLEELDLAALAKGRDDERRVSRRKGSLEEQVFIPGRKNPVALGRNSSELFLLQRVRDESHRFAVRYHRELRKRANLQSVLEDIPGVGGKRKKSLLKHFGSLKRIREAAPEELAQARLIDSRTAEEVHLFFRRQARS